MADGACFGAFTFDLHDGARTAFVADAVVLCGGGHTRLWRRSSSRRDENFGEGMFLALQAGCRLMDMELVQFHPTGMVAPEDIAGTLVTEAVRGEGGRLFNSDGERFMSRYDPERMELSTRDRVALANYTEIHEGRGGPHGGVYLDISHRTKEHILSKLPRMYRQFIEYQMLDISKAPMEVAPTAHYSMGGVIVDPETHATDVAGLFAAGECTAGLHGANRLGGNSLTETVVYGRRAGDGGGRAVAGERRLHPSPPRDRGGRRGPRHADRAGRRDGPFRPTPTTRPDVGRLRSGAQRGRPHPGTLEPEGAPARVALDVDVRPSAEGWGDLAQALDLRAGLAVAEATVLGALLRRESRGCHNRSDYPELDDRWRVNLVIRLDDAGELSAGERAVPPVPAPLASWIEEAEHPTMDGRLLE